MIMKQWSALGTLALAALTQCAKNPQVAPTQAPAPVAAAPLTDPPPTLTAASASATPAQAAPPPAAPMSYPMCGGQHLAKGEPPQRSGAVTVQLAPAFLDEMTNCQPEAALPKEVVARAGEGSIDAKGDCVFASVGVSCHYHSGDEFISSSTKAEPRNEGEIHCIVPSEDPKSPRVYGAHVTCSDPSRNQPHEAHGAHTAKTGAVCNAELLNQLASCQSSKCCDDGTLTGAISELAHDGKNDVRPDFRICEQTLTLDCSLLENLSAHTPNEPALGGIGKAVFVVAAPHAPAGAGEKASHAPKH